MLVVALLVCVPGALAQDNAETGKQAARSHRALIHKTSRRTLTCCAPTCGSRKPK